MVARVEERDQFDALLNEPIPGLESQDDTVVVTTELSAFDTFAATMTAG